MLIQLTKADTNTAILVNFKNILTVEATKKTSIIQFINKDQLEVRESIAEIEGAMLYDEF